MDASAATCQGPGQPPLREQRTYSSTKSSAVSSRTRRPSLILRLKAWRHSAGYNFLFPRWKNSLTKEDDSEFRNCWTVYNAHPPLQNLTGHCCVGWRFGMNTGAKVSERTRKKREPGYPGLPSGSVSSRRPYAVGGWVHFSELGSGSSSNWVDGTTSTGTGRARRATSRITRSVVEPIRCRPTKPSP